jgi:hypothetical protein
MGDHYQLSDEEFMRVDKPQATLRLETVTEAEDRIRNSPQAKARAARALADGYTSM